MELSVLFITPAITDVFVKWVISPPILRIVYLYELDFPQFTLFKARNT